MIDLHICGKDALEAYEAAVRDIKYHDEILDALEEMTLWVEAWLQPKNAQYWSPDQYDEAEIGVRKARDILSKAKSQQEGETE